MSTASSSPNGAFGMSGLPTWWDYLEIAPEERPSLATKDKGEKYDLGCGRYFLGRTRAQYINFLRMCTAINEGFATGMLWGLTPDIQSYLMDKGSTTSRQPMVVNMFTPMLARQLAILAQTDVYARAEPATQRAESRREAFINKAIALSIGAAAGGENVRMASQAMGISSDPAEAQAQAEAPGSFIDPVIEGINSIMTMTAIDCNVEGLRKQAGQAISVSGHGAIHCYFNGSKICMEALAPSEVVWDINARRSDLTDSEFVASCKLMSIPDILELYPDKADLLQNLETTAKTGRGAGEVRSEWPQGMPRPYVLYYKDGDYVERGFIEGPNGPEIVTINEINPETNKPDYTIEDCIDPPAGYDTKDWKGKKTLRKFVVKGRYIAFIPREYCPNVKQQDGSFAKPEDLILASGPCDLMEVDPARTNSIEFPIKQTSYMNIGGYLISPLTAAQSPQRIMNIMGSDITHRISKATGRSVVLDKRALAGGGMKLTEVSQNLKDSDPIVLDGMGGGINNAINMAGEGLDPNIFKEFELLSQLKTIMEGLTQLYDQQFGAPGSANQLVGVKKLQEQQASVAQHPYHDAIRALFEQVYSWIANVGRRHLLRYPSVLEDMVGEKAAKALRAMRDLDIEQVRVKVTLAPNASMVKGATDEMIITQLLPAGLIDPVAAAQVLGQGYPEQAFAAARKSTADRAAAAAKMAEQQQQQAAMAALDQKEADLAMQENDLYNKMLDVGVKSDAANLKAEAPMRQAASEHMKPVEVGA